MDHAARAFFGLGIAAAFSGACSGERWVIGEPPDESDAGLVLDASAAALCGEIATEGMPLASPLPALSAGQAGSWLALLSGDEAGKFPSQVLQLELGANAAHLHFETGSPAPPLLDPRGGYLCHAPGADTCVTPSGFVPAFDYTPWQVRARGSILSFLLYIEQPWNGWCQQQAPVERAIAGCALSYDVEPSYSDVRWGDPCSVLRGPDWVDIDCDRLATVERHPCMCDADGCRASARMVEVNLRLVAPDELEGALWFAADHAQVLHFERQSTSGGRD
jgi:hypothetical protein